MSHMEASEWGLGANDTQKELMNAISPSRLVASKPQVNHGAIVNSTTFVKLDVSDHKYQWIALIEVA